MVNWNKLVNTSDVDQLVGLSDQAHYLIFKHSTSCSISAIAKMRLEQDWDLPTDEVTPFFLDLLAHREVSNYIAQKFAVYHESPQVLLIHQGECIYDASHLDISVSEIREALASAKA